MAQESYLAAYRGLGGFRGESALGTWLYSITYTACLQRLRTVSSSLPVIAARSFGLLHLQRHAHTRTGSRTIMKSRSTDGPKVIPRSGAIVHWCRAFEVGRPSGSATCAVAVA